ncbi:hypothetical protein CPC08DRAFT_711810 [Agrocybe pediades]|nr:hypothetical protein CPC08DRAFT_711810 [Agrocybe pediades]
MNPSLKSNLPGPSSTGVTSTNGNPSMQYQLEGTASNPISLLNSPSTSTSEAPRKRMRTSLSTSYPMDPSQRIQSQQATPSMTQTPFFAPPPLPSPLIQNAWSGITLPGTWSAAPINALAQQHPPRPPTRRYPSTLQPVQSAMVKSMTMPSMNAPNGMIPVSSSQVVSQQEKIAAQNPGYFGIQPNFRPSPFVMSPFAPIPQPQARQISRSTINMTNMIHVANNNPTIQGGLPMSNHAIPNDMNPPYFPTPLPTVNQFNPGQPLPTSNGGTPIVHEKQQQQHQQHQQRQAMVMAERQFVQQQLQAQLKAHTPSVALATTPQAQGAPLSIPAIPTSALPTPRPQTFIVPVDQPNSTPVLNQGLSQTQPPAQALMNPQKSVPFTSPAIHKNADILMDLLREEVKRAWTLMKRKLKENRVDVGVGTDEIFDFLEEKALAEGLQDGEVKHVQMTSELEASTEERNALKDTGEKPKSDADSEYSLLATQKAFNEEREKWSNERKSLQDDISRLKESMMELEKENARIKAELEAEKRFREKNENQRPTDAERAQWEVERRALENGLTALKECVVDMQKERKRPMAAPQTEDKAGRDEGGT